MKFIEVSTNYTDWDDNYEVFLHINLEGKVIRGYCWSDAVPISMQTDKPIKIRKSKNSLFGYLPTAWLKSNDIFISLEGNEDIQELLFKCSTIYPKIIIE